MARACDVSAAGCTMPRWLGTTVRWTSEGASAANFVARSSSTTRPSESTGSSTISKPFATITARFGPNSPGTQAITRRSSGHEPSSRSSARVAPVVNTTSSRVIAVSSPTAARPAANTGSAAFCCDVAADLGLPTGVQGRGVDRREALPRAGSAVEMQPLDRGPGVAPWRCASARPPSVISPQVTTRSRRPDRSTTSSTSVRPRQVRRPPSRGGTCRKPRSASPRPRRSRRRGRARRRAPAEHRLDRNHISIRSSCVFQRATCANAVRSKSAVELPVHHGEHIAVERRGDACAVVVGAHQPIGVLHQVGAQQQAVAGPHQCRPAWTGTRARGPGVRLPMVEPRKAINARSAARDLAKVLFEVATHGIDLDARILFEDRRAGRLRAPRRPRRTG